MGGATRAQWTVLRVSGDAVDSIHWGPECRQSSRRDRGDGTCLAAQLQLDDPSRHDVAIERRVPAADRVTHTDLVVRNPTSVAGTTPRPVLEAEAAHDSRQLELYKLQRRGAEGHAAWEFAGRTTCGTVDQVRWAATVREAKQSLGEHRANLNNSNVASGRVKLVFSGTHGTPGRTENRGATGLSPIGDDWEVLWWRAEMDDGGGRGLSEPTPYSSRTGLRGT